MVSTAMVSFGPVVAAMFRAAEPIPFDYRASTQWLQERHRPGDLTIVLYETRNAIGWYDPDDRLGPVEWIAVPDPDEACDPDVLRQRMAGFDRVLVYGDRRGREAEQSSEALAAILADHAESVEVGDFGWRGIVQVVVLRTDPGPALAHDGQDAHGRAVEGGARLQRRPDLVDQQSEKIVRLVWVVGQRRNRPPRLTTDAWRVVVVTRR